MELILPEPLVEIFIMSLIGINIITSIHILVVQKKISERLTGIALIWILPILGIIIYVAITYLFFDEEKRNFTS